MGRTRGPHMKNLLQDYPLSKEYIAHRLAINWVHDMVQKRQIFMNTYPTSKADGSGQVSSLTGTPQRTDRIWDLPISLLRHQPV